MWTTAVEKQLKSTLPPAHLLPSLDTVPAADAGVFDLARLENSFHGEDHDDVGLPAQEARWNTHSTGPWCSSSTFQHAPAQPAGSTTIVADPHNQWLGSRFDGLPQQQQQQTDFDGSTHHQAAGHTFFLSAGEGGARQMGLLFNKQQQQHQWQPFKAPVVSLEQLWKAGRAATTASVLEASRLAVHESPGDNLSLLLTPGLVVVARPTTSNTSTPTEAAAAAGGKSSRLGSRRASTATTTNSRPNSARNNRQQQLPPLQLQKVDLACGGGGGGISSSRPGSAAATSRLCN